MKNLIFALLVTLQLLCVNAPITQAQQLQEEFELSIAIETEIPPGNKDLTIGKGYDSVTNEVKDQCVVYQDTAEELRTLLPPNFGNKSQRVEYKVTRMQDTEELFRELSLNASAALGWGVFSANVEVSTANSLKFSRYHESLLVKEKVTNLTYFLKTRALTSHAEKITDPIKFREKCGDLFVVGIATGGNFFAIVTVASSSEEEQRSILTAFGASALVNKIEGGTVDLINNLRSQKKAEIEILRTGPSDPLNAKSMETILEYADSLPAKVSTSPWPIAMIVTKYNSLAPQLQMTAQNAFLAEAGRLIMKIKRNLSGLDYINSNRDKFEHFDRIQYEKETEELRGKLLEISQVASRCAASSNKCDRAKLSFEPRELPERTKWVKIEPKDPARQFIGYVGPNEKRRYLRAKGQYSAWAAVPPEGPQYEWSAVGKSCNCELIVVDEDGIETLYKTDKEIEIEEGSNVYFQVHDSTYADNRSKPNDPLEAALYEPLYLRLPRK